MRNSSRVLRLNPGVLLVISLDFEDDCMFCVVGLLVLRPAVILLVLPVFFSHPYARPSPDLV